MKRLFQFRSFVLFVACCGALDAESKVSHPFEGITYIERMEASPRELHMHIVQVDLATPGVDFKLTRPGGSLDTRRATTLDFLTTENAQIVINAHFFTPFPSTNTGADVVGLAVGNGIVYSGFETPEQSYALVANAPAINIDASNRAGIVHRDPAVADGKRVIEKVRLWTALAGSAQIVTDGSKTIPAYKDATHPNGILTPGGPNNYSNEKSWYDVLQARTAIGLSRDNRTLTLFTADIRGASSGLKVGEVADMLVKDYGVWNALNLDGGGSTTMVMEDPVSHEARVVNTSSDNPAGRAVGSNFAVYAKPRVKP